MDRLTGKKEAGWYSKYEMVRKLETINPETVCVEYSGWELSLLRHLRDSCENKSFQWTMTTMPQAVDDRLTGYIARLGIKAVSLSYDSEKCATPQEWLDKASLIVNAGLRLGCNYLIEPRIGLKVPEIILEYLNQEKGQLNLLAFKPTGKLTPAGVERISKIIQLYRGAYPRLLITTDNCLGIQLGLRKDCAAGKEFLHILPSGELVDCCFKNRCFLWKEK